MSETFFSKISHSERETEEIAFNLAKEHMIKSGDIIALYGDLGAGKTAFTRGLTRFFSPDSRVTSPTFSLVNQYIAERSSSHILHFDMYRINSGDDLLSIGFYDYINDAGVVSDELSEKIIVIEWFEKIAGFFDENTVSIEIVKLSGDERKIIYERKLIF